MRFFLKAIPRFDGTLRVLEFYEQPCSDGKGVNTGRVDDGVRKANADIYEPWKKFVNENADELYAAAQREYNEGKI